MITSLSAFFTSGLYEIFDWLGDHYIELTATITGLIYLFYSIKGKMLLWLFGFITSMLYVYVFFRSGIYADMGINMYYVLISVYGWYHWKFGKKASEKDLPVTKLNLKTGIILLLISIALFLAIAFVLDSYTNSDIALLDAFTTAFSITATWMLARKIKEHWLIWIVVDLVSAGLYIYKGLYPTVALFVVYTVMAVSGYYLWLKEWRKQLAISEK